MKRDSKIHDKAEFKETAGPFFQPPPDSVVRPASPMSPQNKHKMRRQPSNSGPSHQIDSSSKSDIRKSPDVHKRKITSNYKRQLEIDKLLEKEKALKIRLQAIDSLELMIDEQEMLMAMHQIDKMEADEKKNKDEI